MKRIITDSICDLKNLKNISYKRIPFTIDTDNISLKDEIDADVDKIINAFESAEHTGTACPGPKDWYDAAEGADEIYLVPATKEMSGSYNAANIAKDMMEDEGKKVLLIDTMTVSSSLTLIVEKIAELIEDGKTFEEIKEYIGTYKTRLCFVLYSIENLVKNGRAPRIIGAAVKTLNLLIIGEDKNGKFSQTGRKRSLISAIDTLISQMIKNGYNGGKVIITHCHNSAAADSFEEEIKKKHPDASIKIMETSGICSYYSEMSGFLVGYEN